MLQTWIQNVLTERARILLRVRPVPEDKIDAGLAAADIYAAAAALLSWERHTGQGLREADHAIALIRSGASKEGGS